ncbi:nose resistant to fluoxetine protein 6-like isoform X1 [Penaeus chinensis]|uniref:nose resistant to fluoxetine protein 6-like isoform X1 n=2 Tax=Penaeus chinensis TaxID=139456 RepID=UPI001FB74A41|nr:nose resistant to fluoxetine protein 6-like isoform X1 [Penaeus chinensis]XP_047498091.1 nose resistant to fluoxetine protein 6-like isoform X1 [Penaeus chinensis]
MTWTLVSLLTLLTALASAASSLASDRDVIDPAKAWLSHRAAHWANMYLPGTAPENSTCQRALQAMAASLADNTTLWAAKFVDSWAKVPDGLYMGNWALEGVYDECVGASSPDGGVRGKFCRVFVFENGSREGARTDGGCGADALDARSGLQARLPPLFPTRFDLAPFKTYSTCMPDACTEHELQESVSAALADSSLGVRRVQCHTLHEAPEFTAGDIAFIALLSALLFLMVAASALDVYLERTHDEAIAKGAARFLLPFSAYTNLSKLFQLNTTRSSENITCLHGIRVLSMIWVVYGHQHEAGARFTANLLMMFPKTSGFLYQIVGNAYFSVDSFFFLSGFLVSYVLLREMSRTGRFNVAMFYLHRLIRLLPPIALATGLFATVARFFLTGPLADSWTYWQKGCAVNWWKDLVFVNNFLLEEDDPEAGADCLIQAWYLAVDTQLYLVAPLVILPLHYFKAAGLLWLYVVTLSSVVIPAAVTYAYDLQPSFLIGHPDDFDFNKKVYLAPWCRAGPWLVGVWLGYVFHKQGQREVVLRKWQVVAGWTTSTVVALLLVLGLWSYNVLPLKAQYDIVTQVTYAGLSRPAWGAVLAWVVYACHFGYGGPVDGFLSHPSWQPISRVTYSTYLVAMQIQYITTYTSKAPFYFTPLNVLMQTAAALVASGMVGVVLSLTAEAPVIGLEKLLLRRPGRGGGGGGRGPEAPGRDNKAFEGDMEELPRVGTSEGGPGAHDGAVAGQETVTKF